MSDRSLNLTPVELESFKSRVRQGLYSSLERDLIVSQLLGCFQLEDAPEETTEDDTGSDQ